MASFDFQPEVLLAAFGFYAVLVLVLTLWNARQARRSARLDEAGPGGHVLHERRPQAIVGQVSGGDR